MSKANKGNPDWIKGGPSPNPRGRGVSKAATSTPKGSDGSYLPGGFTFGGERDRKLIGLDKWVTFDNIKLNTAIVASAMRTWIGLGASAKSHAEPNKRGGKDAHRAADIVTEGLLENNMMSSSWRDVVKVQLLKSFEGAQLQALGLRRRSDGMVVFADIARRPMWTVYRWIKPDDDSPWTAIEQRTKTGRSYTIPREELFYSVEGLFTSNPDGVGLLRHVVEIARVRDVYANLEGIGAQTDLNGMPIARVPLAELTAEAKANGAKSADEIKAYIHAQVQFLSDFLKAHNKKADQGLMLGSQVYTTKDQAQTPSAIFKYAFDVVRSAVNIAPIGASIMRLDREMARVMCAEWLLMGEGGGSRAMHQDKTDMFGMSINGALRDVAGDATRQLAALLVARNGLDPETCTPTIVFEPIATQDVETACRSLLALAQAGLDPDDDAPDVLRDRMDLPARPKRDPGALMLPRKPGGLTPEITTKPTSGPDQTDPSETPAAEAANVNATPEKKRRRRAA